MILKSTQVFRKQKEWLYPKWDIRIGGITIRKDVGIRKGSVSFIDMIFANWRKNLQVQTDGQIMVITGIY